MAPDRSVIDLSRYRLDKASEMLTTARRDMDAKDLPPPTIAPIIVFFTQCAPFLRWMAKIIKNIPL